MKKMTARTALAAVALVAADAARAAGDSGTGSVGQMEVSGSEFAMLVGGLVGLGVVIWLVVKFVIK